MKFFEKINSAAFFITFAAFVCAGAAFGVQLALAFKEPVAYLSYADPSAPEATGYHIVKPVATGTPTTALPTVEIYWWSAVIPGPTKVVSFDGDFPMVSNDTMRRLKPDGQITDDEEIPPRGNIQMHEHIYLSMLGIQMILLFVLAFYISDVLWRQKHAAQDKPYGKWGIHFLIYIALLILYFGAVGGMIYVVVAWFLWHQKSLRKALIARTYLFEAKITFWIFVPGAAVALLGAFLLLAALIVAHAHLSCCRSRPKQQPAMAQVATE